MPKPFPTRELNLSDFHQEAKSNIQFAEPRDVSGDLPEQKETFECANHGVVNMIYIPKYARISDRLKGVGASSHVIVSACRQCVDAEQKELFAAHEEKIASAAKKKKDDDMLELIESRGVPLRNIKYEIDSINAVNDTQKDALNKAMDMGNAILQRENAGNLILSGSVGTGKTLIAGALVASLTRSGKYAKMRTVSNIVRTLKGSWRRDCDYTEQEVIDDFIKLDLLVIDEIGVQFGSDTEKMFIFEIIDGRYNKIKPTILISNLAVAGIQELIGERCINRLKEDNGKVIAFDFESQRGKK